MFSGQGSQYFQMGRELFDGNGTFRHWMLQLDGVARREAGRSVVDALYTAGRGKSEPFDRTLLTHPAIFMVEYALAQCLLEAGVTPDMVLGVSMGSFAAAAVAGSLDVDDALAAAIGQAAALEGGCERGGMIAVLGDPALFGQEFLAARSELAAVNFATHFVVTAPHDELSAIEAELKRRSINHQRLPVSLPFHSRWMERAEGPFASFMKSIPVRRGRLPLACCEQAAILSGLPDDYFWAVVRRPIRFREAVARLEEEGPCRYIDVGPAGTLATFLKYGLPATTASAVHAILTPYGVDRKNLAAVSASAGH